MLASFFAAFFFALNATCATHSVRAIGAPRANVGRLIIATLVLALFAHTAGFGFASASTPWFLLSGVIGMGLGDLATYAALPLLGSRLTVLMIQCLAAPIATLGEWLWLGTRLTGPQIAWGLVILAGVAFAIVPTKRSPPRVRVRPVGFLFGFLAACGQGFGALVSRKGVDVAAAAGESAHNAVFGLNAAYLRILAGLVVATAFLVALRALGRLPPSPLSTAAIRRAASASSREEFARTRRHSRLWMLANGFAGPVLGVGSYQWALATTPSGIVLPIAATAPLISIPIAFWLEGDRPTRRSLLGGALAVTASIALTLTR